jgi:hypothetical protein
MVILLSISITKQKNHISNEISVNPCPHIFVFNPLISADNGFLLSTVGQTNIALYTVYGGYPQLSTAIHKEKKKQKEKSRQHHYGYHTFFFKFNTLKSTPNYKTTTPASVTFLNELTR